MPTKKTLQKKILIDLPIDDWKVLRIDSSQNGTVLKRVIENLCKKKASSLRAQQLDLFNDLTEKNGNQDS